MPGEPFQGVIGIDLGTTFSCVAVLLHNTVDVIPNDQGNRTTPSRVGFVSNQVLVGDAASTASMTHPRHIVFDAKRMIGRAWNDANLQKDRETWPFDVAESGTAKGTVEIVVDPNVPKMLKAAADDDAGEAESLPVKRLSPEQVSATLLRYLKGCAERHLGKAVKQAVITVPAYFNDAQRERTRAAGTIAGLEVLRIVNEPTAAALAYGLDKRAAVSEEEQTKPRNILVFDFGGGTFDVSVISVDQGTFMVVSTAGNTHLGGQDIDAALTKYFLEEINRRHKDDLAAQPRAVARLRVLAERAKKALSFATEHLVEGDGLLPGGNDFHFTMTRAKLEELCTGIFKQCLDTVAQAMKDAKMEKGEIDEVVLVGGSTRIPKVRKVVQDYFNGKQLNCSMNPDEAIAVGAAIQGAILSQSVEQQSERLRDVVLMDVVPLSLGVDLNNGTMDVLIPRNHTIPHKVTKTFSTFENNQTEVTVQVYEGERPRTKQNRLLGEFDLTGITKAKKGIPSIDVTFDVDANGMLTVSAGELTGSGRANKQGQRPTRTLVVKNEDRLSTDDIGRMIEEAEKMEKEDAEVRVMLADLRDRESALDEALEGLKKVRTFLVFRKKRGVKLMNNLEKALAWIRGTAPSMSPAAVREKYNKLDRFESKAARLFRKCEQNPVEDPRATKESDGDENDDDDGEEDDEDDDGESGDDSGDESDVPVGASPPRQKRHRAERSAPAAATGGELVLASPPTE